VRFKQSRNARLLAVAAAFPLAIIHNTLRLIVLFVSVDYIGPVLSLEHIYHVLFSWSLFAALLATAIGVDRLIAKRH
jgi:exosortase/archaeosortase family protein